LKEKVLGRTGLKVKTMGFGGIPIQRVSEAEAVEVVRRCYEHGLNYFDTARGYTNSEERIGKALEDVRDKVYLATKSHQRTAEGVFGELETSLKNLKTDHVDVYQLHNVTNVDQWKQIQAEGGALEAVFQAREEGMVRHIGVTSHNPDMAAEIVKSGHFETLMIQYNYIITKPEEEVLPLCRQLNVGTIAMKPFGGGAFSNANTALKYVYSNPDLDLVVPGTLSVAEVDENVKVWLGGMRLTPREYELIEQDKRELGSRFCRGCDYCQPCPQEIPISFILRAERQMLRRMGWTDARVEQVRNAKEKLDVCAHCGACESRCPYQLHIQELLPETMASLWGLMEEYLNTRE
jgi:predicted aldo/keto reductase-like oxidoreductase